MSSVIHLSSKNKKDDKDDLLNKINNIGVNINQMAKIANTTGEIYFNDLKLYYSEISKLINEIRKKFL